MSSGIFYEVQELAQRRSLQDCYGQQWAVYQHHVQELLAKWKYEYNRSNLQYLLDHFKARQLGFRRNDGSTVDQLMVVGIYEEFLGDETLKEWHIHSEKTKGPATGEQFLQFVEERVHSFPMQKKSLTKSSSHRAPDTKAFIMQVKPLVDTSCPACNGTHHALYLLNHGIRKDASVWSRK